jgi:hypothetical protein
VSYGSLDLKFKNNTGNHMLIKTCMQGNTLTVKIYGNNQDIKNIQLKSWVTETIEPKVVYKVDPTLQPEESKELQKGARGYKAKAQRIVFVNGKEVGQEALPSSYYLPVEQIIAVQSDAQIPSNEPVEEPKDKPVESSQTPDSTEPNPGSPLPNPTTKPL